MFALIRSALSDAFGVVRSLVEWRNPPIVGEYVSAFDSQFVSVESARRWSAAEWAEDLGTDWWSAA